MLFDEKAIILSYVCSKHAYSNNEADRLGKAIAHIHRCPSKDYKAIMLISSFDTTAPSVEMYIRTNKLLSHEIYELNRIIGFYTRLDLYLGPVYLYDYCDNDRIAIWRTCQDKYQHVRAAVNKCDIKLVKEMGYSAWYHNIAHMAAYDAPLSFVMWLYNYHEYCRNHGDTYLNRIYQFVDGATDQGRIDLLKWLNDQLPGKRFSYVYDRAINRGNIDMLKWYMGESVIYKSSEVIGFKGERPNTKKLTDGMKIAAKKGHIEMMIYLHSLGASAVESLPYMKLESLKWCSDIGIPLGESVCYNAARANNLEILEYMTNRGVLLTVDMARVAASNGSIEAMKYIIDYINAKGDRLRYLKVDYMESCRKDLDIVDDDVEPVSLFKKYVMRPLGGRYW